MFTSWAHWFTVDHVGLFWIRTSVSGGGGGGGVPEILTQALDRCIQVFNRIQNTGGIKDEKTLIHMWRMHDITLQLRGDYLWATVATYKAETVIVITPFDRVLSISHVV